MVFIPKFSTLIALICTLFHSQSVESAASLQQIAAVPDSLSDSHLRSIDSLFNLQNLKAFTTPLLVERHVNAPGHETVRQYLAKFFRDRAYVVEEDVFRAFMPNGTAFTGINIMASTKTVTPNTRRLILACHWDSKYFAEFPFIAATDSAVPCGIMLWIADAFAPIFQDRANKELLRKTNVALQFVFFDGEEAIEEWTDTDSIYGSRHLAEKWQAENKISSIDLFVLLDLLGSKNPQFYSFFHDTAPFFKSLGDAEKRLKNHWTSQGNSQRYQPTVFGNTRIAPGNIADDHLPFIRRNVPVLHMIPYPFPNVWHRWDDNAANIDWPTSERLARIFAVFTMRHVNGLILANNRGASNTLRIPGSD